MASQKYESQYLHERLRERKAENARNGVESRHSDPDSLPRRSTPGRDDVIFADDATAAIRNVGSRQFQSSRHASHARRTSNTTATPIGSRVMGAREVEDHVDKLSKQNFDLKLEIYHRREKINELEKKLEQLPQLEDDNAELLEVNEHLLQELDKRDQAIDEAVLMICELEEQVRILKRDPTMRRADERGSFARAIPVPDALEQSVESDRKLDSSSHSLAPFEDIHARTAELSFTARPTSLKVPSFMSKKHAGADTLRSQYMDGDRQIRPIPSFGTMTSQSLANEGDDVDEDILQSPALSELSESEFKSLYGRDAKSDTQGKACEEGAKVQLPTADSSASETSRRARTNRWVHDTLHNVQRRGATQGSREQSSQNAQFQSLSGILHDASAEAMILPRSRKQQIKKHRSDEGTADMPSLAVNPVFGQNAFPPTPDTMLTRETRPSNQSSLSIAVDKNYQENPRTPVNESIPAIGELQFQRSSTSGSRHSFLPPELDAYDSGPEDGPNPHGLEKQHSKSSFRSEGNLYDERSRLSRNNRGSARHWQESPHGTDRYTSPLRSGMSRNIGVLPAKQQLAFSRRQQPMDIHGASIALEDRALPRRRSISVTPTQHNFLEFRSSAHSEGVRSPSSGSHVSMRRKDTSSLEPRAETPTTQQVRLQGSTTPLPSPKSVPQTPPDQNVPPEPPKHSTLAPPMPPPHASTPRATDNLRQRMSKFARRNSNSTTINQASEPRSDESFHTPPSTFAQTLNSSTGRSNSFSLRTRKLFHRRRSSVSPKSPPTSPTQQRRRITRSNGQDDVAAVSRSSTFMDAAKAATPHLDLKGNERKTPSKGISTEIPFVSTPPQQQVRGPNDESFDQSISSSKS